MSGGLETGTAIPRAWVMFTGQTDLTWLRVLRPGFRHCFLALNDGRHWLTLDPLASYIDLAVQPVPAEQDLPDWYRRQGLIVVEAQVVRTHQRPAPFGPFSCVEAIKRTLGIHDRWLITPFQLYRHLQRCATEGGDAILHPQP